VSRFGGEARVSSSRHFVVVEAFWLKDRPLLQIEAVNPNTRQKSTYWVDENRRIEFGDILEDYHTSKRPQIRVLGNGNVRAVWVDLVAWRAS
jgi:hypothetical protein